jgi:hypothetical protein
MTLPFFTNGCRLESYHIHFSGRSLDQLIDSGLKLGSDFREKRYNLDKSLLSSATSER